MLSSILPGGSMASSRRHESIALDLTPDAEAMKQEAFPEDTGAGGVRLAAYGIDPVQAADLRARFAAFAGEWERPEMDVYDDYDAAKARLEAQA